MTNINKWQVGALAMLGLSAAAFLSYNRINPEKRKKTIEGLKRKGRHLYEEWMPHAIRARLDKPAKVTLNGSHFGEGSYYSS